MRIIFLTGSRKAQKIERMLLNKMLRLISGKYVFRKNLLLELWEFREYINLSKHQLAEDSENHELISEKLELWYEL